MSTIKKERIIDRKKSAIMRRHYNNALLDGNICQKMRAVAFAAVVRHTNIFSPLFRWWTSAVAVAYFLATTMVLLQHYPADAACACQSYSAILADFYAATGGSSATWKTNWSITAADAPCSWFGVTCTSDGNISSLSLVDNGLTGTLPSSLSGLGNAFTEFSVGTNAIGGTVPESYKNWSGLRLFSIAGNSLTGTLPSWFASWTRLVSFEVSSNMFSGTLPQEYGAAWASSLTLFDVSGNAFLYGSLPESYSEWQVQTVLVLNTNLSGTIPSSYRRWGAALLNFILGNDNIVGNFTGTLPASWANWTNLNAFEIFGNQFYGTLPSEFGRGWQAITQFTISNNRFNGPLPVAYGGWANMNVFQVSNNSLSGTIPSSYTSLGSARRGPLNFQCDLNRLTGSLPPGLANWTSLSVLDVSSNQLSGTLPDVYGSAWTSMSTVYLNDNTFTGTLPTSWGNWGAYMRVFYCANNQLSGTLPASYASWVKIERFQVDSNNFTGQLPSAYAAWGASLGQFMLSYNQFTGTLPIQWGAAFTSLSTIFVSHNQLDGSIPASFFQNSVSVLGFGFNRFSGTVPTTVNSATLTTPTFLELQNNTNLDGPYPTVIGIVSSCGTGLCGASSPSTFLYTCMPGNVSVSAVMAEYVGSSAPQLLLKFLPYAYTPPTACPVVSTTPAPVLSNTTLAPLQRNDTATPITVSTPVATSTAAVSYAIVVASGAASVGVTARGAVPSLQRAATVLTLSARCRQAEDASTLHNGSSSSAGGGGSINPSFDTAIDNPLRLSIQGVGGGDASLEYTAGAAIGNTAIVIAMALLSQCVRFVLSAVKKTTGEKRMSHAHSNATNRRGAAYWRAVAINTVASALPSLALPGSLMLLFNLVLQPSIGSSVLLIASSGRSASSIAIGCVALLLWLGTVVWFVMHVAVRSEGAGGCIPTGRWQQYLVRLTSTPPQEAQQQQRSDTVTKVTKQHECGPRHILTYCVEPKEAWTLLSTWSSRSGELFHNDHDDRVVLRILESTGVVIEPYVGRRAWYFAVEWALTIASGVTSGLALAITGDSDSTISDICDAAQWGSWVALALTVADVGLCLVLQPLSVRADFDAAVMTGVLSVVSSALALAGDDDNSQAVVTAAAVLQVLFMALLLLADVCLAKHHRRAGHFLKRETPNTNRFQPPSNNTQQRGLLNAPNTVNVEVGEQAAERKANIALANLQKVIALACKQQRRRNSKRQPAAAADKHLL